MLNRTKLLIAAVKQGDAPTVQSLLAEGADPNGRDRYGLTALMWAARKGKAEVGRVLLDRHADPNERDVVGQTALHHAVLFKHEELVDLLIKGSADVDAKGSGGWTPLALASDDFDTFDIARRLLEAGAQGGPPDPGFFGISMITPGDWPLERTIYSLRRRLDELAEPNPYGERGALNFVLELPMDRNDPDFTGLRKGRFFAKCRLFYVAAVVPIQVAKTAGFQYLIDTCRSAVKMAQPIFHRAKVPYPVEQVENALSKIEAEGLSALLQR